MKDKKDKLEIISFALLAVTMFIIFFVHRQVPFMMDDLWYGTNLLTGEPLTSLQDVIDSQIWHYYNWGGRSVAHFFLQLILMGGEVFADILNMFATVALMYMVCKLADVKSWWGMLAAISLMIGFNGDFSATMFWQSGALNYVYLMIFICFYLWCFFRDNQDVRLYGISIWMIPLGLVAGWSNENMGPMAWVVSLIIIILRLVKKEKIKVWMVLGNISCLVGSVLVVAAPGNFVRVEEALGQETRGELWQAFLRCYAECSNLFQALYYLVILVVLLAIIAKIFLQIEFGRKNWLLLLGALLSWGAMIMSPVYPVRATFGTMVLLVCIVISLLKKMMVQNIKSRYLVMGVVGLAWFRAMFLIGQYLANTWGWFK